MGIDNHINLDFLRDKLNLSQREITAFLIGITFVVMVLNILNFAIMGDTGFLIEENQGEYSKSEIGVKTTNFVNKEILNESPNKVNAKLLEVKNTGERALDNFYEVKLKITNPAGSQNTSVYTSKDGSITFLQLPRKMGKEFDEDKYK